MLFPFPLPCSLFNVMAENSMVVLNAWRWGMAFLCLLLFYILVSCFSWYASPFINLEWHDSVSYEEHLTLLCLVLTRSGTEWSIVAFVWFLIHLGIFLKKFGNFSQSDEPVGNRFNWFSTTAHWLCQLWGPLDLSLFSSHSSELGIEHHCFCLIPYSFRNFLKKFGNFSQPDVPVGNRFNGFSIITHWIC